jgi:hypothetical protein
MRVALHRRGDFIFWEVLRTRTEEYRTEEDEM